MEVAEKADKAVQSAIEGGTASPDELAEELASLPEREAGGILQRAVREQGRAAISLLLQLALASEGRVSILAVETLGGTRDMAAADALQRIALEARAGDVRKSARRGMHRLASQGITPTAATPIPRERQSTRLPVYRALSSFIDGQGRRGVWLALDTGPELDLVALVLNDTTGIEDAHAQEIDRSTFDQESARFMQNQDFPWVETPPDYARHLVEEAHARNGATRSPLPVDYIAWRDRIGRPEEVYQQPLVYSVITSAEVRWDPRFLDSSAALFDVRPFQTWVLDESELGDFIREMTMARQSGLVLAGATEETRDRLVIENAIQKLFTPSRRTLYKRRLEEVAYLLWKMDRGYQARQALASALAMEPQDRSLLGHPFVRAMVAWSLEVASGKAEEERTREIKPGVQLLLPY